MAPPILSAWPVLHFPNFAFVPRPTVTALFGMCLPSLPTPLGPLDSLFISMGITPKRVSASLRTQAVSVKALTSGEQRSWVVFFTAES